MKLIKESMEGFFKYSELRLWLLVSQILFSPIALELVEYFLLLTWLLPPFAISHLRSLLTFGYLVIAICLPLFFQLPPSWNNLSSTELTTMVGTSGFENNFVGPLLLRVPRLVLGVTLFLWFCFILRGVESQGREKSSKMFLIEWLRVTMNEKNNSPEFKIVPIENKDKDKEKNNNNQK